MAGLSRQADLHRLSAPIAAVGAAAGERARAARRAVRPGDHRRRRRRRRADRLGAQRLRGRPQHPASRPARVRAVHAPRAAARFPGARGAARASLHHHLRCPLRAAGRARDRRGRDGRLQHLLRDPVVRQAGADRAAHRAASGTVPACRARQPSWAWCACCPTTACGRRGAWPSSCMRWPAGRARGPSRSRVCSAGSSGSPSAPPPGSTGQEQPLPRSA